MFKNAGELIEFQNTNARPGKTWVNDFLDAETGDHVFVATQETRTGAFIYAEEIGPRCATKEEAEKYLPQ